MSFFAPKLRFCLSVVGLLENKTAAHRHNIRKLNVSGRSWLCSTDDNQLLVPRTQTVTLILVLERSPHPDLTPGTLRRLSCAINLCLWTVSNVRWRLLWSVRMRPGFLIVTGACVTIFVNCAFLKCQFVIIQWTFHSPNISELQNRRSGRGWMKRILIAHLYTYRQPPASPPQWRH